MFYDFHNSAQKDKYFTSIITCWGGALVKQNNFAVKQIQRFLVNLPIRLKKAYFNQNIVKNNIWYAIFEGEKMYKWLKYVVKNAKRCILCELDSGIDPGIDECES